MKWNEVRPRNLPRLRNRRGLISSSVIRDLARQIVSRFQPDKIILFGSYARGQAEPESDVDILVVMPARNEIDQSVRIEEYLDSPFNLDIIVRTPRNMHWRLEEGDWFLREAVGQGKILYDKADNGMGAQSRRRSGRRTKIAKRKAGSSR
jgi:predicted nucleotidyltransferase